MKTEPDHGAGSRGGRNERRLRRKKRSVNGCDCKNFILDLRFHLLPVHLVSLVSRLEEWNRVRSVATSEGT